MEARAFCYRLPVRVARIGLIFGLVWSSSCLIELRREISCGDGFVDVAAGEQCDPNDISRAYESACVALGFPEGRAQCNPETCQIISTPEVCTVCNDGVALGDEQCDESDFNGKTCPGNSGELLCTEACTLDYSSCESCGNGLNDPNEECEYRVFCETDDDCAGIGGTCDPLTNRCLPSEDSLVTPIPCTSLSPPPGLTAYGGGTVSFADCSESCTYGRLDYTGCGNGVLDGTYQDFDRFGNVVQIPGEVCENPDNVEESARVEHCQSACTGGNGSPLELVCDVQCSEDCRGFIEPDPEQFMEPDPSCCVKSGFECDPSDTFPCCWELANPGSTEDACQLFDIGAGELVERCK